MKRMLLVVLAFSCVSALPMRRSVQRLAQSGRSYLGRTHFVIGANGKRYVPRLATNAHAAIPAQRSFVSKTLPVYKKQRAKTHVLFSPDDDVRGLLLDMIEQEQSSIKVAVFMLTEPTVAQALCLAQQRGINVQVVTDPTCLKTPHNEVPVLLREGVSVYMYNPKNGRKNWVTSMHHKFVVFARNMFNRACVWTGSFNFTRAARTNQENVVVLEDRAAINKFNKQFEMLKERSDAYRKVS